MKQKGRRVLSLVTAIVMIAQMLLIALPVTVKAETTSIFTDYLPEITPVTDEAGFTHPGVGLTKELLANLRSKVRAGAQPWTYYFNTMLLPAAEASKTVTSSNSGDGKTPSADYFDSQGIQGRFIADSIKAYAQAVMYYVTGDEVYRANAMMIIRIWEQMDPAKYKYYSDAHIHAGIPLNRMLMAAEIMRYTSTQTESLAWTDQDTAKLTNNLIIPITETLLHSQHHFMNQHNYPLIGAISGYIFTGNRERYNEAIEWFTVNRTANDQGFNGSIKALFRWVTEEQKPGTIVGEGTPVEPHVQHMEMGRDQAHGGGDLTNAAIITRLIHAQGTKVDPVAGTPSTADNAVDIMEFLNHRLLAAADYFWQFMLGYDTPWTPQAYAITGGDPDNIGMGGYIRDTYNTIAHGYWGRFSTANFWDFYSYYTYVKHEDVSQIAPYYYEAFTKKLPSTPDGWRNKDAGNDFWLYLPQEAEADAAKFIPQDQTNGKTLHLEDRYTNLDNNSATMQEGDTRFIRFNATQEGSQIAVLSFAGAAGSGPFGFKIRTNGVATFDWNGSIFTLPDTKGEWKYVVLAGGFGDMVFMTVKGTNGVTVDIDSVDAAADTNLTPPVFKAGSSDLKIYTYVGATVNVDLSATDASSTDVIAYELQNNSQGLPIDAHTGAFSWHPTEAGNYSVIVAATDGTAVSAKNVNIIVSSDRASAVQAITSSYNQNQVYVEATLNHFHTIHNDTLSLINTASEVDFDKQLQALRAAVDGLALVTPLTDFGMPWSKVVAWSTFGKDAIYVNDGDWESGAWFGLAQGSPPHLYHLLDFGPDYKVSVTKFGFKSNIFVDRLANSTVYGSNDKVNWTRLTPGVTQYTQAYHTLDADPAYQNEKYRYIKLEMIKPLPDVLRGNVVNLLEMRDFDIYGTRHEIGNKLQSVSLSSDQALNGRVALGHTIKVSIKAKEAIQDVKVNIQGQDATVSTTDHINWTATAILTGQDQIGDVKVSVDYTKQNGTNGDTLYGTTDGSKLFAADDSDLITNAASLANLIGYSAADTLKQASYLFDNNSSTASEFRLNGSGAGSYMTFDFREGNQATLSNVELLARQDQVARLGGTVVQGSNDNTTWTTLTKAAASTADWQMLKVSDTKGYRYIRIYNANTWYGNMAEVRLHGAVKSLSQIASSSISSAQSVKNRIVPGNTVKLAFTSKEAIHNVNVTIQGLAATVTSTDHINWTAEATLNQGTATGTVNFAITYNQQDGAVGFPIHSTTDNSTLFLVDESDLIGNVTSIANLIDSTSGRTAATTLQQVNYLFDNNANSSSDFRIGSNNSGSGSYITFDFKEGNQVTLSNVELLARQDQVARINGAVVQGSNDNTTWTTLTNAAVSTPDWQTLPVSGNVPYRYIRIYNGNAWFGNMAEVRFHGKYESLIRIQSASISSPQSIVNRIVHGNTVKLAIVAKDPIKDVKVAIQGQDAVVSSTDNINWTATATLNQGVEAGPVKFNINYNKQDGTEGYPATQTTDNTSLYVVDESDVIKNVTSIANLIDSTSGRTAAQTLQQVNYLFDSNVGTGSDFRIGNNSGAGSYIIFEFKAGNQATLSSVELLGRTLYDRIRGAVVQGSNDNTTWTTLTTPAVSTPNWQTFEVSSKVPYRYIKIYNANTWYGNMAEVRFHGVVKPADVTPPVTTDDAPQGSVVIGTTINLNAADNSSGVAATYYTVDGGTQQEGNTVTLTTDGEHTIVYWSVDWAGNEEQRHTLTVNIDDTTSPDAAGLYADITAPTNQDVSVTIYYPLDAAVKEYKVGDNGEWTVYTAPVTVSDNTTVYARSADAAGNISEVASYTVSNIYKTAPSDAIFTADMTDPTSGNVTLTISYPDNATVKEYKIGENGTWTAYESPVTVSDNVIVYAQSKDFVGNVSNVISYTVSNIDRTPPADAVLSTDITAPTNQDVTVTVTYPVDAAVKEYKVGETGVWTAYGAPVAISENSTVYARSTDAAGNVSNITQYAVGNIDRMPPADAILAVDTEALTNQGVTVTITYPDDAVVKEYKVGDSGQWEAYTEPVVVQENDTVYARGTDAVGNVSNVTSTVVGNIWNNAPVTTAALSPAQPTGKNSWYTTDVTVSLSVSADPAGGAVITEYQVNDGEWMVYTGSIPSFGDGVYKLSYRSKDAAGNVEQLKTIEFKVDKTAPALSVQLDKTMIWPPNHKMVPINATLLSSDDGSGIESVVLTSITSNLPDSGRGGDIQADFGTAATSFSVRAERGSIYTITYTVTDKAGNKTVVTATVTVTHDQSGKH
ncbi:discoidin domain-containing protein [Paenibacillus sp. N4]|uniref:OmpL47-type beta-barrel domain-containing protein n=1 Tax=Paenibacillus vietnamensis TaxID=2590547 RepID=UPI001CD11726|nr:discoidin domain-containing protein [Paenibacillus vietnamensis]MCA0755062.1 discoidin domain-containing protein [Paenibacillus vietnamensis]